jgi:EAL domain-containing protein (putative c-di-GMP-specific phosphodiesterase class I)
VVAEGVETTAQEAVVERVGCRLAQGYYYSRPRPRQELATLIGRALPASA